MGRTGDDVVEAIAVDVIDMNLGCVLCLSFCFVSQGQGMSFPRPRAQVFGRLIPRVWPDDVRATVSVHVAHTHAVVVDLFRNDMLDEGGLAILVLGYFEPNDRAEER